MPFSRKTGAALLLWVNTYFPIELQLEALADLCDGLVFCKMLEDFDPEYAISDIERNADSPSEYVRKKTCLEAVYRSLLRYIHNHTEGLDELTVESAIDFNKIAEHDDLQETMKLLTIFLLAAVNGPDPSKYIGDITEKLDNDAQFEIMNLIQNVGKPQDDTAARPAHNNRRLPPKTTQDFDLAFEEEHAKLFAEHNTLKKNHADFITRFEHLQEKYDNLYEDNKKIDQQLRTFQDASRGDQADQIKRLLKQLEEAEELIAQQEADIELSRQTKEHQNRELAALRPSAERAIRLDDEVKVLKNENEALTKRANAVDHLNKKLENQTSIERDNAKLRDQVDILQGNQKEFDRVMTENYRYASTINEYSKKFEQYEAQVLDYQTQKRTLQDDLRIRDHRIDELEKAKEHDSQYIKDLQEQQQLSGNLPEPVGGHLSLEEELAQKDGDTSPSYDLELSRLRAENQHLKSTGGGTANATLRLELEESQRIRSRLKENLQELLEKHTIGQEQLQAIISTSSAEKDEAIARARKLYLDTKEELGTTKAKLVEVQAELSSRDRELQTARGDLSAINAEEIDALEKLKAANEIVTSSLQKDLLVLQESHNNLKTDFDQHQSHLVAALLAKSQLQQDLADAKENKGPADSNADAEEGEKTKSALQALQEQNDAQEKLIDELQKKLKTAEEAGPDAQKAANEAMIKNLTRENAMISTAWYDLTSRLQSNHVVLQRRQDAPKSWLNKQRQMVNATPRR